jgi:hypothetical protein
VSAQREGGRVDHDLPNRFCRVAERASFAIDPVARFAVAGVGRPVKQRKRRSRSHRRNSDCRPPKELKRVAKGNRIRALQTLHGRSATVSLGEFARLLVVSTSELRIQPRKGSVSDGHRRRKSPKHRNDGPRDGCNLCHLGHSHGNLSNGESQQRARGKKTKKGRGEEALFLAAPWWPILMCVATGSVFDAPPAIETATSASRNADEANASAMIFPEQPISSHNKISQAQGVPPTSVNLSPRGVRRRQERGKKGRKKRRERKKGLRADWSR